MANGTTAGSSVYNGNGASGVAGWRLGGAVAGVPVFPTQTSSSANTGSSITGSSIQIRGLPPSTSGLLLSGDLVQIGNQLCRVIAPLDSDAAGLGYLQIDRPLVESAVDGDPVIICSPMGRFILSAVNQGVEKTPGVFGNASLDFIEA